jgi:hypothetical protein
MNSQYTPREGVFDPRDFGAILDGQTDDLPALQMMISAIPGGQVHWPAGMAWLSDTWHIIKRIQLIGTGGGTGGSGSLFSGIEHAAGRIGITIDQTDGGDNSAQCASIERMDFKSQILVHPTHDGSALDKGLSVFSPHGRVRVGEVFVKQGGSDPPFCFRAISMIANDGRGPGYFGTTQPTWTPTIGGTIVDNGVTWRTERIPRVRSNKTDYTVGDVVYADGDNRFLFTCEVAGTSDTTVPDSLRPDKSAGGISIGSTVIDGNVTWRVSIASHILLRAGLTTIRRINGVGATTFAVTVVGGPEQDSTIPTSVPNADNFALDSLIFNYCGGGVYVQGDDTNGYHINRLWGENLGTLQPTPNVATAAGFVGLGGHLLHCHSMASGKVENLYAQLSTGRPILKTGLGRMTVESSYEEVGQRLYNRSGTVVVTGGSIQATNDSSGVSYIDQTDGRGLGCSDDIEPGIKRLVTMLDPGGVGAGLLTFRTKTGTDSVNFWAWKYGYGTPVGWWGLQHGNQSLQNAFLLASSALGLDPCPGWLNFQYGYLLGDPLTNEPLFVGHVNSIALNRLRAGLRKRGDTFRMNHGEESVALEGGFRGNKWVANTPVQQVNLGWGVPPTVIEPSATFGITGGKVFRCTKTGTTAMQEPNWALASRSGESVADNDAEWTLVGFVGAMTRQESTTTTAAPNQVIAKYPASAQSITECSLTVLGNRMHTDDFVTASGTVYVKRNGNGNPSVVLAEPLRIYATNGLASTRVHVEADNLIPGFDVQVDPVQAVTLDWVCSVKVVERVSH